MIPALQSVGHSETSAALEAVNSTSIFGGKFSQLDPPLIRSRRRRRQWGMTNSLTGRGKRPLADPAGPITAADAERIANAIEAELAPATRETYACGWRQWDRWCQGRGIEPLPAPPEALAAFLAERAEAGLHFTTLDAYCSGIAHRHGQEGLPDPTAHPVVRRVRRGLRRIIGVAPLRQAHPLTVAELSQIIESIDAETVIGIRDRAILLLGYASAMRPGEVAALDIDDIGRKPTGILITIRRSKTDRDAAGQVVGVARGQHLHTDPVRALDDWLALRPTGPGPLFTRVYYRNHPRLQRIGPRAISRTVQERAHAAGFDNLPVTGHSLRAGHATTAAVNGVPIDRIAAQTRHRDLSTLLNHYIRPAEAMMTTTSRDLGL